MNRRDLFRLAGAVAVAPRAMLAAPVVTPDWLRGECERIHAMAFAEAGVGAGDYWFAAGSYSALMTAMPGRQLAISGLGDEDDDGA
jgi:hypothetical protein